MEVAILVVNSLFRMIAIAYLSQQESVTLIVNRNAADGATTA